MTLDRNKLQEVLDNQITEIMSYTHRNSSCTTWDCLARITLAAETLRANLARGVEVPDKTEEF